MLNAKLKPVVLAVAGVLAISANTFAADAIKTEKVEVISTTPLAGIGLSKDKVPSNVQTAKSEDIDKAQSLDLSEFMNRNLGSVYINENQGNPLQPDVNYRGFTSSPLLGTPQGMSVYMDGVRLNQAFGDIVSWDLIPKNAIKNIQLMPGSNPLFGLNTLGGALSIQTKDGRNSPGGAAQVTLGSYARKLTEFEYGGVSKDQSVDYFVAATYFDENGWRDHSQSDSKQLFTKIGWQGEKTDLKLTYAYANSDLNGNGLVQRSFLERDYRSVNTYPDNTKNESHLVNLNLSHYFNEDVTFSGNTYYRHIKTNTLNGDLNDGALPDSLGTVGQYILSSNLGGVYSPSNSLAYCQAQAAAHDEAAEKCSGIINRTVTTTDNFGIFGQVAVNNKLFDKPNTYTVGGGFDYSRVSFNQTAEYGAIALDRGLIGSGYFADQTTYANANGVLDDRSASIKSQTLTWSAYGTDTISILENLHLTASGRYNHTKIKNRDQQTHYVWEMNQANTALENTGAIDANASLDGTHTFSRFNPAVGLTYSPTQNLNTYASYNEGNRAPTSMELGCANENAPCNLPNSMAGDPPLKQVVSKTWEAGLRGRAIEDVYWNLGLFSTLNQNDIQFIAANTSQGFFSNVGETRRQGLEAGLNGKFGKLSLGGNYTYLDATYESDMELNGAFNSSNSNGKIQVKKGDRIPLVPQNLLKIYADYKFNEKFTIGLNSISASDLVNRGNENNQHVGSSNFDGKTPGYTVVNFSAAYQVQPEWLIFARVNNVFDREYETAGMLGQNPFDAATGTFALESNNSTNSRNNRKTTSVGETFVAPGAPRTAWIGVRYEFGGAKKSASVDRD